MTTIELEAGSIGNLLAAEPLAGIVTMKFLKNLMNLNPALRPPVEHRGVDEMELWQSVWSSVYSAPFATQRQPEAASEASAADTEKSATAPGRTSAVGEALLWTLESCFREDFTPDAKRAWETLYRFVNETAWARNETEREAA
jgi:hemoglobin-like flavoprotein